MRAQSRLVGDVPVVFLERISGGDQDEVNLRLVAGVGASELIQRSRHSGDGIK